MKWKGTNMLLSPSYRRSNSTGAHMSIAVQVSESCVMTVAVCTQAFACSMHSLRQKEWSQEVHFFREKGHLWIVASPGLDSSTIPPMQFFLSFFWKLPGELARHLRGGGPCNFFFNYSKMWTIKSNRWRSFRKIGTSSMLCTTLVRTIWNRHIALTSFTYIKKNIERH